MADTPSPPAPPAPGALRKPGTKRLSVVLSLLAYIACGTKAEEASLIMSVAKAKHESVCGRAPRMVVDYPCQPAKPPAHQDAAAGRAVD